MPPRGVRLAAEWEPHAATWLSWPHNIDTWPGSFDPIPEVWSELARAIAAHESVHVLASGEALADAARRVGDVPGVAIHDVATNDAWIRDHGPMFLSSAPDRKDSGAGESPADAAAVPHLVDWEYDAWGGKYPPFDLDNAVPRQVAERLGATRYVPSVGGEPIVLEGGAIESNGQGTVLACESCLIGPRRNASLSREDIERLLADYAGVRKVIWLTGVGDTVGIAGDDTDGHIDQLARFVGPNRVVVATEEDAAEENFPLLESLWCQLSSATDAEGQPLELVRLPMPRPVVTERGERLPASYANFYVANHLVVVPQFDDGAGDGADDGAAKILADCFPGRELFRLPSLDLVRGLGGVHCVTLSQPVG